MALHFEGLLSVSAAAFILPGSGGVILLVVSSELYLYEPEYTDEELIETGLASRNNVPSRLHLQHQFQTGERTRFPNSDKS